MASDDLAKLGWITDRLPTEADGDRDGDVKIPMTNSQGPEIDWRFQRWDVIVSGQPWWSPKAAAAAASETGPATEPDRIAALEQRVEDHFAALELKLGELAAQFWGHSHGNATKSTTGTKS
jgi:hypothetical protein